MKIMRVVLRRKQNEVKHKVPQPEQRVIGPRFEPSTSWMPVYSITTLPTLSIIYDL